VKYTPSSLTCTLFISQMFDYFSCVQLQQRVSDRVRLPTWIYVSQKDALVRIDVQTTLVTDKGNQESIKYETREVVNPKLFELHSQYKAAVKNWSEIKRKFTFEAIAKWWQSHMTRAHPQPSAWKKPLLS
jgi:hypothetical protein